MGMDAYIHHLARDARHGGDLLEQFDADQECQHGRLPHDRTPECGCWTPSSRPQLQLVLNLATDDTAVDRIAWLRRVHNQPGMSHQKTADAYNQRYGCELSRDQVRWLLRTEVGFRTGHTLRMLGVAA